MCKVKLNSSDLCIKRGIVFKCVSWQKCACYYIFHFKGIAWFDKQCGDWNTVTSSPDFLQAVNPRATLRELLYMCMLFFRLSTTTENYFHDSKNKDAIEKSKPEKYGGHIKLQIVIFLVYGFLYFAIITGSVCHYKNEYEKGNTFSRYFEMLFHNK